MEMNLLGAFCLRKKERDLGSKERENNNKNNKK